MARMDRVWKSQNIIFSTKHNLYKSLVIPILLYECKTRTLLAVRERRIQAFEKVYEEAVPGIVLVTVKLRKLA